MIRIPIVLNPTSGGGAGGRQGRALVEQLNALGVTAELHETTGPTSARSITRAMVQAGHDAIIAAGGDGTIHEVANGLLEADGAGRCALGLIPVGTGNDFVKVVPGTATVASALQVIAAGRRARFDVGRVHWTGGSEFFVNGMGTGIDVEVVRQLTRMPQLPGAIKYLLALVRALFSFEAAALRVTVDGGVTEQRMMIVAVGNGVCQGGGFYLAPRASIQDGRLDVTAVDQLNLLAIARVLPKIMRGTQQGDPAVAMRTGRAIRLESMDERPLFFHLDGELREPAGIRALDVEVLPAKLLVMARVEDS